MFLDGDGAADPGEIGQLAGADCPAATPTSCSGRGSRDRVAAGRCRGTSESAIGCARASSGCSTVCRSPTWRRFVPCGSNACRSMALDDQTYGWPTEMIVKAARAGWRITEVPGRLPALARADGRRSAARSAGTALATGHILRTIAGHVADESPTARGDVGCRHHGQAAGGRARARRGSRRPLSPRTPPRACTQALLERHHRAGVSRAGRLHLAVAVSPPAPSRRGGRRVPGDALLLPVEGPDIGVCLSRPRQGTSSSTRLLPRDGAELRQPDAAGLRARARRRTARTSDVVIGPSEDGGYYLVGSGACPGLFTDIDWSTERVAAQTARTRRRARALDGLAPPGSTSTPSPTSSASRAEAPACRPTPSHRRGAFCLPGVRVRAGPGSNGRSVERPANQHTRRSPMSGCLTPVRRPCGGTRRRAEAVLPREAALHAASRIHRRVPAGLPLLLCGIHADGNAGPRRPTKSARCSTTPPSLEVRAIDWLGGDPLARPDWYRADGDAPVARPDQQRLDERSPPARPGRRPQVVEVDRGRFRLRARGLHRPGHYARLHRGGDSANVATIIEGVDNLLARGQGRPTR